MGRIENLKTSKLSQSHAYSTGLHWLQPVMCGLYGRYAHTSTNGISGVVYQLLIILQQLKTNSQQSKTFSVESDLHVSLSVDVEAGDKTFYKNLLMT